MTELIEQIDAEDEKRSLIAALTPFADRLTCPKGKELNLKNGKSHNLYFVTSGAVEVFYVTGGTQILVALIGSNNFFGEIGFFDGISRVRNMRAYEDTELLLFEYESLRQLEQTAPQLFIRLLLFTARSVCTKFRGIVEENGSLPGYGAAITAKSLRPYDESTPLPGHFFQTEAGKAVHRLVEDFKAGLYNVSYRLQEDNGSEIPAGLAGQCYGVLDSFYEALIGFAAQHGEAEEIDRAWGYLFKEIFPYFMRSRFAERIYYKPKGYAGDFMMMEMIYRNLPDGDGKLGKLVDDWCLRSIGAQAIRGRRRLLTEELGSMAVARRQQEKIRVMNLACGPSRELFDFLTQCDSTEKIEVFCVDIDADALQFTKQQMDAFPHQASIRLMTENVVKWSLGRARHDFGLFDCIYSAGLTDYLDERLFIAFISRCYQHLKPGGVLIVGNFSPNPDQVFMDHILQWRLLYRDADTLRTLFAASPFGEDIEVLAEEQHVNLFVRAMRRQAVE